MKIFNTLTRRKEEFVPLEEGKVKMYVCGPTVYNLIHIGNARPMIIFDTVRRYMEYKGYEVNYVSNFTDVDDKIIKKAIEEGVSAEEISTRYIKECKKDMADMNVKPATTAPQATQEIQGMIDMIQTLIDKGYAYPAADGTVYFRVKKFKEYGKLSHKNLDDLQSGFRSLKVSGEDQKEDPLDFVLWKPKKEGEPSWPSPWCDGRPGWHIECSVMSKKYLGEEIDIHAGGEDLIFPHHENEIAQSECCNGKIFARYWMHNGFLNIDNRKMSKSLGNFRTVRQIGEQYDLQVLRFFMLNAHYRSPLNFSADLMEAAKNSLERIPIIRALNSSLTADEIDEITGILNGTTNYMLYKMSTENCDFDTVLKEAQAKGYAEADPTADVGGADACRKIAILSSLAYGKFLNYEDIYTEGITKITPADMEYAKELGMTIKLLATSRRIGDSFYAMVAPFLVGQSSPLYSVNDVFNAVFVHGNVLGDAMFYGSGAGKLPTASAVVADVVDEAKHLHRNIMTNWSSYALKLMDMDEVEGRFFVRVSDTTMDEVEKAFGDVQTIEPDDLPDEFGFITPVMKQAEYYEKISKLTGKVLAMIRVKD